MTNTCKISALISRARIRVRVSLLRNSVVEDNYQAQGEFVYLSLPSVVQYLALQIYNTIYCIVLDNDILVKSNASLLPAPPSANPTVLKNKKKGLLTCFPLQNGILRVW